MTTIPYIKCNDTLYKEIKPLLEQVGYTFDVYWEWTNFPYLVINMNGQLGKCTNIEYDEATFNAYHREFCDSKEEFIEKAVQLMMKEVHNEIKNELMTIPYIKCNDTLYKEIKPLLEQAGYTFNVYWEWTNFPYLVINMDGQLGKCTNTEYDEATFNAYHRELCDSKEEFIKKAVQLINDKTMNDKTMNDKINNKNTTGQSKMKKSDLQTGMIAETNKGKKYVVLGNILLGENDSHSLSIYDDDLRCEYNECSIKNIYEADQNWAYGMEGGIPTTPLLWTRKKKYTLKEIAEALGIKEDEFELDI